MCAREEQESGLCRGDTYGGDTGRGGHYCQNASVLEQQRSRCEINNTFGAVVQKRRNNNGASTASRSKHTPTTITLNPIQTRTCSTNSKPKVADTLVLLIHCPCSPLDSTHRSFGYKGSISSGIRKQQRQQRETDRQ